MRSLERYPQQAFSTHAACSTWCKLTKDMSPPRASARLPQMLDLTEAEVTAVASFYTMYVRRQSGRVRVGVCINSLCAILGGDAIWDELVEHCGVGNRRNDR